MSRAAVLRGLVAALAFAACGGDDGPAPATDAPALDAPALDAPLDPFAGLYDGPEDFPRTGCRAGALAGFATSGVWPELRLRIAAAAGQVTAFHTDYDRPSGERPAAVVAFTADDLVIRFTQTVPVVGGMLEAIDICDVRADGSLVGNTFQCTEGPSCSGPYRFVAEPLHRAAGEAEAGGGLTLLGELALEGRPVNVRVAGDLAYLPMHEAGLRIVSFADPAAPVKRGWYMPAEEDNYNDVKLLEVGGRRYAVTAGSTGSDVIDVTDPAAPQLAARIPVPAHTLDIEGTRAYLVTSMPPPVLHIYELANPAAPALLAAYPLPGIDAASGLIHDLHVSAGLAYLDLFSFGMVVVDCRTPASPSVVGATPATARGWHSSWLTQVGGRPIVLQGDEGFDTQLRLLDGDPTSPTFLSTLGNWFSRPQVSLHNLMARGAIGYAAHYQDGVRVFDLSNPAAPAVIAFFNTWREADASAAFFSGAYGLDLDPVRHRIYVADSIRGLVILEGPPALFPP